MTVEPIVELILWIALVLTVLTIVGLLMGGWEEW